jgi:hypothetical protein
MRTPLTQIVDGDCGTWVIDFHTGDLLGHLVSGYNQSEIAYVMPAEQIFRDINDRLGKLVELSTRSRRDTRARARELAMDTFTPWLQSRYIETHETLESLYTPR